MLRYLSSRFADDSGRLAMGDEGLEVEARSPRMALPMDGGQCRQAKRVSRWIRIHFRIDARTTLAVM